MIEKFDEAVSAYESKNFTGAYELFKEASIVDPNAMINLAIMSMKGIGCTKDNKNAKEWFEQAAEQDNLRALSSLGHFYEKGILGEIDDEKALSYYKKAADLGDIQSQLKAGMLFKGKNENAMAMRYLIAAAHNKNEQAQSIVTYVSNASLADSRNEAFHSLGTEKKIQLVNTLIETKIKPALAQDEGGIEHVNFIDGDVPQIWLTYTGACSGCHLGSTSTADMLLEHFETMIDKNVILYIM
ncbi:SEL1-like repeat protein [bacterium]|nr:SEL1-like repeat protein [bacterium]